jgi:hypothetical protein
MQTLRKLPIAAPNRKANETMKGTGRLSIIADCGLQIVNFSFDTTRCAAYFFIIDQSPLLLKAER